MRSDISNDNDGALHGPDAHGQAAMLLVESLVHGLIARDVLTVADAVEIVDIAAEVRADVGAELSDPPAALRKSVDLLTTISSSLRRDIP